MNADVTLYVRVIDPQTGTVGFLPIMPAIRPDSSLRFHRGRPPQVQR